MPYTREQQKALYAQGKGHLVKKYHQDGGLIYRNTGGVSKVDWSKPADHPVNQPQEPSISRPTSKPTREEVIAYHSTPEESGESYADRFAHTREDGPGDRESEGYSPQPVQQVIPVADSRVQGVSNPQYRDAIIDVIRREGPQEAAFGINPAEHLEANPKSWHNAGQAIQERMTEEVVTAKTLSDAPSWVVDKLIPDDAKVYAVQTPSGVSFTFGSSEEDALRNYQNTNEFRDIDRVSGSFHDVFNPTQKPRQGFIPRTTTRVLDWLGYNEGGLVGMDSVETIELHTFLNSLEPKNNYTKTLLDNADAFLDRIIDGDGKAVYFERLEIILKRLEEYYGSDFQNYRKAS